jgi:hypothetical protein
MFSDISRNIATSALHAFAARGTTLRLLASMPDAPPHGISLRLVTNCLARWLAGWLNVLLAGMNARMLYLAWVAHHFNLLVDSRRSLVNVMM